MIDMIEFQIVVSFSYYTVQTFWLGTWKI